MFRQISRRNQLVLIWATVVGFLNGSHALVDNSVMTHIRVGMDMLTNGKLPTHDHYSFTAYGDAWHSQSPLPNLLYGLAIRLNAAGYVFVLLNGVLWAIFAYLLARIVVNKSFVISVRNVFIAGGLCLPLVSQRPLVFLAISFALLVNLYLSERSLYWAIAVGALWQCSHGSAVLGIGFLLLLALGQRFDGVENVRSLRLSAYLAIGIVVGALVSLNPSGLLFFLTPLQKGDVFKGVLEWRSPDFHVNPSYVLLIALIAYVVVLIRNRAPWSVVIPSAAFIAISLWSVRNFLPLAVVAGFGLHDYRNIRVDHKESRPVTVVDVVPALAIAVLFLVHFVDVFANPAFSKTAYPVKTVSYLAKNGWLDGTHPAHREMVGNYLECRFGRNVKVMVDDRFDFFPARAQRVPGALSDGETSYAGALDRYQSNVVIWAKNSGVAQWLDSSDKWRRVFAEKNWAAWVREGTQAGKAIGEDPNSPCAVRS